MYPRFFGEWEIIAKKNPAEAGTQVEETVLITT